MLLTRRQFIDKLKAIAVVAPIAPAIIEAMEATADAQTSYSVPQNDDQKLTLAMLEQTYQMCCYGYEEPDLLLLSPDSYAHFMEAWTALKDTNRFLLDKNEVSLPYFNGAAVTFCKALPRNSWFHINTRHPDVPLYSGWFNSTLQGSKLGWRQLPKEMPNG